MQESGARSLHSLDMFLFFAKLNIYSELKFDLCDFAILFVDAAIIDNAMQFYFHLHRDTLFFPTSKHYLNAFERAKRFLREFSKKLMVSNYFILQKCSKTKSTCHKLRVVSYSIINCFQLLNARFR